MSAFLEAQTRHNDELLGIAAATKKYFPTISEFCVRRWIAQGVGKPPVRLKAVRLGGRYFLRAADVAEFLEAQANPDLYKRRKKSARVEKAKRRLQRAGA